MEEIDVEDIQKEFDTLSKRINLLNNRFIAIAMDYKFYIKDTMSDHEIFRLRDNVMYKLECAIFHFQLLLEYHNRVEFELDRRFKNDLQAVLENKMEYVVYERRAILEVYSIFDSMVYHVCSIFDYLFRLVNFSHDNVIVDKPLWNLFKHKNNLKDFRYCTKEMVEAMEKLDSKFVYPLIRHRSHLIHTAMDIGEFTLLINLQDSKFNPKFLSTELFKKNFPEISEEVQNQKMTIKYSALWLIDKTIKNATELLFELSDDMKRNKKIPYGMFVTIGPNNEVVSPSTHYWGDRNVT